MVASIDTEALRRKYAEERDKRLRPDGNDQYLRLTGELAHYLDDPYTPRTERAAITDHRTVVCVGGGSPPTRPAAPRTRTWCRTAGPTSPAGSAPGSPRCRRSRSARERCSPPTRSPTSRRWRRSAPAPTPSCGIQSPRPG